MSLWHELFLYMLLSKTKINLKEGINTKGNIHLNKWSTPGIKSEVFWFINKTEMFNPVFFRQD